HDLLLALGQGPDAFRARDHVGAMLDKAFAVALHHGVDPARVDHLRLPDGLADLGGQLAPKIAVERTAEFPLFEAAPKVRQGARLLGVQPNGVALEEPFRSSLGPIMNPPSHPNCRCSTFFRTDAAGLLGELNPAPRLVTDRATGAKRYETLGESYRRKPGPLKRRRR
ncbi:MAG: hypothetical protein HY851_00605, partial [candidate division Zixibacteria bacterium]|nr:hypothetical protein [candidate division Zixibacteria bacterium]